MKEHEAVTMARDEATSLAGDWHDWSQVVESNAATRLCYALEAVSAALRVEMWEREAAEKRAEEMYRNSFLDHGLNPDAY